ncbi:coiled-coil protein [Cryptosporidium felis]|nr:coiled-coil protein [Cryptosporidium felis]
MYKSAHEEFFDFILKSHVHHPKLNREIGLDTALHVNKLETPLRNSKTKTNENICTSNKSKKKSRSSPIENDDDTLLTKDDSKKTTNELLKELAQTVKEGQSLQKDVEVLKKVVFNQQSWSSQFYNAPHYLELVEDSRANFDSSNTIFVTNKYSNDRTINENIDYLSQLTEVQATQLPFFHTKVIQYPNDLSNTYLLQQNFRIILLRIIKKIKQTEHIQVSIRDIHQKLKSDIICQIERGKEIITNLCSELNNLNKMNMEYKVNLKRKEELINKIDNSIKLLNIENNDLKSMNKAILSEKITLESEMNNRLSELEDENNTLKHNFEKISVLHEQTKSELEKNKDKSVEFEKLLSQLKNLGVIEKVDDSKYLFSQEKRSINDELIFLRDILKDKRDQEEILHKNITQLSDENVKLSLNYNETKTVLEKKMRENCILQSILDNYKVKICELEERNSDLQSEIIIWQEKLRTEAEEGRTLSNRVSQQDLEIQSYKEELNIKTIELNNSLSRLGHGYVELNEVKQSLKELRAQFEYSNEKIKSLQRENQELNDALSNQFQFNRRKDVEIDSMNKENGVLLRDLEIERSLNKDLKKKISELEINYSKIENERLEIHKELNNKCIDEIEKKETMCKISKELERMREESNQKEIEVSKLKKELMETTELLEKKTNVEISVVKHELIHEHNRVVRSIEESKRAIKIENENLLEEVNHQKKMIQDLIYEKISLNNELKRLKETVEVDKRQFESSINVLSKELGTIQELGSNQLIEKEVNDVRLLVSKMNELGSQFNLLGTENENTGSILDPILQSTTAPPSNYTSLKSENSEYNNDSCNLFPKAFEVAEIANTEFCKIEASLSAQCEMAFFDIISQTERFKILSNKLRDLEEILRRNNEKSISEIVLQFQTGFEKIGFSLEELLSVINSSNRTSSEIEIELSNKITEISHAWVMEAEASKYILENAHKIRNIAAKKRMKWIKGKNDYN